nr:MAG TPA: hypothetical protein [Caudoviricetes sp.]
MSLVRSLIRNLQHQFCTRGSLLICLQAANL